MTSVGVDHWITSPYCFCKDLPWLVLSSLPSSHAALLGGWGWADWALLAAILIALAFLLLLLSLLACLLCPPGLCWSCCCGPKGCCSCCSAGGSGGGGGGGGEKGKKEKKGLGGGGGGNALEMSSIGGSEESNLTAVDLKLPRAWMDSAKGDLIEERGDLGLGGGGGYFGNQKTWTSANGHATIGGGGGGGGGEGRGMTHSANVGNHLRRSVHTRQSPYDVDSLDGGHEEDSGRTELYRDQSTVTVIDSKIGEHIREAVQEWQKKSGLVSQKLEETRQSRNDNAHDNYGKNGSCQYNHHHQHQQQQHQQQLQQQLQPRSEVVNKATGQDSNSFGYSSVKEALQRESRYEEESQKPLTMALVKTSASGAERNGMVTSGGSGGAPIMQCYTVTKKTTTTTYGDEEGDEETSVVTTTEKQWREGMNEVGEISVSASASAGELLPHLGAPAQVLNDVNNVRVVRSMTNVDGAVSNVVRRYDYQQTMKDTETLL